MSTDPGRTAALDQWRASASSTLDVFVEGWRKTRANPVCDIETDLGALAMYLRGQDPGVVADLLAIAVSRLGGES